jgi:hypothetical protein
MQYVSLIASSASGKAGGVVATRGRAGLQLRALAICRQRLTASASEARAITGGLPALWRALTPAEQQTWSQLASTLPARDALGQSMTLSGYALYIACSRRLITIGITNPLSSAPTPNSIPAILGFSAAAVYTGTPPALTLSDFALSTYNPLPNQFAAVLRASGALSNTQANVRASNLRVIEAGVRWPTQPHSALAPWLATYGTAPAAGTVTFALSLVDPATGLVGAEVRAAAPLNQNAATPPPTSTLTIQVGGVTVAVIPDASIGVDGTIIAN